jgi:hypothetical protein
MPSDQALSLRLADPELAHVGCPSAGVQPKTRETKNQAVVNSPLSLLVDAKALAAILSVSVATVWRMDASWTFRCTVSCMCWPQDNTFSPQHVPEPCAFMTAEP